MKISKTKFVFLFLIFGFAFHFFTFKLLEQQPDTFLGSEPQAVWQSVISTIVSPVKIILNGPILPFIKWYLQAPDPPPPFLLIGFALYWTILALTLYYFLGKIKRPKKR
jgi:hypothetical protein